MSAGFRHERRLIRSQVWPVAGVDEVGRGPLAGPVVAAAVILDPGRLPKGVDDSKALSAARREALSELIVERALAFSIASCSVDDIARLNIRGASLAAMTKALAALHLEPVHALFDGRDVAPGWSGRGTALIGGDGLSASIAAASILAKVARDRMMAQIAQEFPAYGFERHMGYATAEHRAAIDAHGPCPHHRMSFGVLAQMTLAL
jgi:ribonuclease HII